MLTNKALRTAWCLAALLPAVAVADTIKGLDFNEYSNGVKALNAACTAKGSPAFSGFCLSREHGPVNLNDPGQTSITLGLEVASLERFYAACEHSDLPSIGGLLAKATAVLETQKFLDEMKPQEAALNNYVGRFFFCRSKGENDAQIANKVKWFEYMIQKYGAPRAALPETAPALPLIRSVWEVTQLSCNGFVAHASGRSPHAEDIRRTGVVLLPQVKLQFGIPRLPDLAEISVRLVFNERGRKVVDHYILLAQNDLDAPVAALLVTELPPSVDTPQKAFGAAVAGERGNVEGTTAQPALERVSTPWGEGLDLFVPNRIGSPCFPTARYKLSPAPEEKPTIGLSRFVVMPGLLVQFALVMAVPPVMSAEEQKAYARKAMDGFAAGLRPL